MMAEQEIIIFFVVLDCARKAESARILDDPNLRSVFEDDDARINCSLAQTSRVHQWKHRPRGNKNPILVSDGAQLTPKYQHYGRYNVTINSRVGRYDLLIISTKVINSGIFYCFEDNVERAHCNISVHKLIRNLTVTPVNTIVVAGDRARLNCSTSYSTPVYWQRFPLDSTKPEDVFLGRAGLQGSYSANGRFQMEIDPRTGQYDLTITNVTKSDAGTFKCLDKSGFGSQVSAELTILEAPPSCSSNASSDGAVTETNSCGLEPDIIRLSCGLPYHGNLAPTLEWSPRQSQDTVTDFPFSIEAATTTNKTISNLTLQARSWMSSEQFECRVKELDNMQHSYNCTVPQMKVIDFSSKNVTLEMSKVKQSTCSNFSQIVCSFDWKDDNGTSFGEDRIFPTSDGEPKPGKYSCIAACSFREVNCSLLSVVNLVHNKDNQTTRTLYLVVIPTVVSLAVIIVILLISLISSQLICPGKCLPSFQKHDVDGDQEVTSFRDSSRNLIPCNSDSQPSNMCSDAC